MDTFFSYKRTIGLFMSLVGGCIEDRNVYGRFVGESFPGIRAGK